MTLTVSLYILAILWMVVAAKICLHYWRINQILRLACKDLITLEARGRKVPLTPEEVESELDAWIDAVGDREGL